MRKRSFWTAVGIMIGLIWTAALGAQDASRWTAWLYAPQTGAVYQVAASGALLDAQTLPLPADYELYPYDIALSPDGQIAAYVVSDAQFQARQWVIYDLAERRILHTPRLDISAESSSTGSARAQSFDSSGERLAFGYGSARGTAWQLDIYDLGSGELLHNLNSTSPLLDGVLTPVVNSHPLVLHYADPHVDFALVAGGGEASFAVYRWDAAAQTVRAFPAYRSRDFDSFAPTGEIVSAYADPALPGTGVNTLAASAPDHSIPTPFYTLADRALRSPRFVHNGAQVLVQGIGGEDGWLLLGRGGTVRGIWTPNTPIENVVGTADGWLFTAANDDGTSALFAGAWAEGAVNTRPVWSSADAVPLRIIWLDDPALYDAGDYATWGDASALVASAPTATPTGTASTSVNAPMPDGQPAWSAWLHDGTGDLLRVRGDGVESVALRLPRPPEYPQYAGGIAVSRNGDLIAYHVSTATFEQSALLVYNVQNHQIIAQIDLGAVLPDTLTAFGAAQVFNETDTAFAAGYALADGGWQVLLIDLITGSIFHQLTHADLAPGRFADALPLVQHVADDLVWVLLTPEAYRSGRPTSIIWDTRAGTVAETPAYPGASGDTFLTTGEAVTAFHDPRLPSSFDFGIDRDNTIIPQANALFVYRGGFATIAPFYSDATVSFDTVRFVENGARLLVSGVTANATRVWQLVGRDGALLGSPSGDWRPTTPAALRGLTTGFAYLRTAGADTELRVVDTRAGVDAGQRIWMGAGEWTLLWAREDVPTAPSAYPAWAQAAPPLTVDDFALFLPQFNPQTTVDPNAPTPTVFPTPLPLFVAGMQAQVQTLEGEILNLRDQPGVSGTLLARIEGGVIVTLLADPVAAEGFVWWQVRVEGGVDPQTGQSTRGLVGWVVENTGDLQTLIPVQPTPTATGTP